MKYLRDSCVPNEHRFWELYFLELINPNRPLFMLFLFSIFLTSFSFFPSYLSISSPVSEQYFSKVVVKVLNSGGQLSMNRPAPEPPSNNQRNGSQVGWREKKSIWKKTHLFLGCSGLYENLVRISLNMILDYYIVVK